MILQNVNVREHSGTSQFPFGGDVSDYFSDAKQRGCSFIADKGWDCLCAAWMMSFFKAWGSYLSDVRHNFSERRGVKAGPQATAESGA